MRRSEINRLIREALGFFEEMNFKLPPWGYWPMETWKENKAFCEEIFENELGWDLTDFGSDHFSSTGLILFTLRNGNPEKDRKPYAEKIMIVDEDQVTPMHFHLSKMEDIINRGGGNLMMQLYPSNEEKGLGDHEFEVNVDGIKKRLQPGTVLLLKPGESISLYQGLYHKFYGQPGKGKVLVGEVSSVNDDHTDNHFYSGVGRFPEIEEDSHPTHLLIGDYKKIQK
jgi:D-lyxose ketol-isomerase